VAALSPRVSLLRRIQTYEPRPESPIALGDKESRSTTRVPARRNSSALLCTPIGERCTTPGYANLFSSYSKICPGTGNSQLEFARQTNVAVDMVSAIHVAHSS
jgi:hypothetical protein